MPKYTTKDTIETLDKEQLDFIAKARTEMVLFFLEDNSVFDVNMIRLMFELGAAEAARRLEAMNNGPDVNNSDVSNGPS